MLQYCPRVLAELSDLPEFYDPDTVELISWIRWVISSFYVFKDTYKVFIMAVSNVFLMSSRSQAPVAAVFAGSPQMLGMVKLCSGAAVTSLPLYSDINLLRRTEDVSEMSINNSLNVVAWSPFLPLFSADSNKGIIRKE